MSGIHRFCPWRTGICDRFAFLVAICLVALLGHPARAQDASEYQVKAAFLCQFTKFVEWPSGAFADANSPFVIGVVGKDPFGAILERAIDGKSVDGRSFVIRRFSQVADVQPCHLLFVCESDRDQVSRILARLGHSNTLTVGDFDQFIQRGGTVNFFIEDSRVRFEINPDAADSAGLKISSKLLHLARVVRP